MIQDLANFIEFQQNYLGQLLTRSELQPINEEYNELRSKLLLVLGDSNSQNKGLMITQSNQQDANLRCGNKSLEYREAGTQAKKSMKNKIRGMFSLKSKRSTEEKELDSAFQQTNSSLPCFHKSYAGCTSHEEFELNVCDDQPAFSVNGQYISLSGGGESAINFESFCILSVSISFAFCLFIFTFHLPLLCALYRAK